MAHVISDECVKCGACAAVCPTSCITEGETQYVINEEECVDCCSCESECPTGAITQQ
ncbi:MAG: 4Fe-4S binding protein [Eubacteriales bacterium]|nr:4Fe-4S binding protein [Eubacteriales bacterium]